MWNKLFVFCIICCLGQVFKKALIREYRLKQLYTSHFLPKGHILHGEATKLNHTELFIPPSVSLQLRWYAGFTASVLFISQKNLSICGLVAVCSMNDMQCYHSKQWLIIWLCLDWNEFFCLWRWTFFADFYIHSWVTRL